MLTEAYHTKFFVGHEFGPTEQKFLSIHIGGNSIQYAISTSVFNEVFELGHLEFTQLSTNSTAENLEFFLQNFSLKQQKFEKVNIAVLTHDFTLLPEAFTKDQELKSYLSFTSGNTAIRNTLTHHIRDIRFCYSMDQELLGLIERSFSNSSIRHAGAVNLQLLFNQHSVIESDVFLSIGDTTLELAVKEKDKLIFYNIYRYATPEDILYYLLFAMEQFQLNPLTVKLSIAAQMEVNSELAKSISKYIKHVSFAVTAGSVKTHKEIAKLPQHYYFTLLNQHLCEL